MNRSEIHVIDKHGVKKVITRKEYNASMESSPEQDFYYEFDVDWYLSHGCVTLEQMIDDIDGGKTVLGGLRAASAYRKGI